MESEQIEALKQIAIELSDIGDVIGVAGGLIVCCLIVLNVLILLRPIPVGMSRDERENDESND